MLQNSRVTAFTVSDLLRENQQDGGEGGVKLPPPPPPTRLGLKALFVHKIVFFLLFLSYKIYDVITWLTNNYSAHIPQYLKKERQPDNEIWSIEYNKIIIFLQK